jgi:CheY-like chemotaxis protein
MPPKILLVDDDPLIHMLYRGHLEKAGYEMVAAHDGSEAVEIAALEQPSLIVMDIMMGRMNGLAALRQLKKSQRTVAIPVLVITAAANLNEAARRESALSGAAGFLPKPFSPSQLVDEIKRYVPQT